MPPRVVALLVMVALDLAVLTGVAGPPSAVARDIVIAMTSWSAGVLSVDLLDWIFS